jgi:hypothetical protein
MGTGFPTRTGFDALSDRYRPLLPSLGGSSLSSRDFVHALLAALDLREVVANAGAAGPAPIVGDFALGVRRGPLLYFFTCLLLDCEVRRSAMQTQVARR